MAGKPAVGYWWYCELWKELFVHKGLQTDSTCKQPRPQPLERLGKSYGVNVLWYCLARGIGVLIMCATLGMEGACFELLCGRTQPRSRKDHSKDLWETIRR